MLKGNIKYPISLEHLVSLTKLYAFRVNHNHLPGRKEKEHIKQLNI
jgi:hypothetical protein